MAAVMDGPFDQVVAQANVQIKRGATVFQKFTCAGCGKRLAMDVPNVFYTEGTCDACGALTDIKARGCGFLLLAALTPEGQASLGRVLDSFSTDSEEGK